MNINLSVPFFSQRDNSYIWKQRYYENAAFVFGLFEWRNE